MRLQRLLVVPALIALSCGSGDSGPAAPSTPPGSGSTLPPATTPPSATNHPPTVRFKDIQPPGVALSGGTNVQLGLEASDPDRDPLSYAWDFGDGTSAVTGGGASHVFIGDGTVRVTVTVTDGRGGSASTDTEISVRKLAGTWDVDNARHKPLVAKVSQGEAAHFNGKVNDGSSFSGNILHPRRVFFDWKAKDQDCIPSGRYEGVANEDITRVEIPGHNCAGFALVRR